MVEPLWTSAQIAAATGGTEVTPFEAFGVSIDSRDLQTGDLFIALKGEKLDGHRFIGGAFDKGAAGVLIEDITALPGDRGAVVVENTQDGLTALGAASRLRLGGKVIGVTGSVGKTGTKTALAAALAKSGTTFASVRSFNNHIGVPLTLARTPPATDYTVLEMGMNHAGELRFLTHIARPHIALVTTIEAVHTEFFDSIEQVADAKAEIFEGLQPGGTAILNRDNRMFDRLLAAARAAGADNILSFGEHEEADVRLVKQSLHDDISCITADVAGVLMTYKLGIPGDHWVRNSLGVLAAVHAAGADLGLAGLALADQRPPKGRGRRHLVSVRGGSILVIDESYNASPVAMKAAIRLLGRAQPSERGGRRIAVLGDMRELGETGPDRHRELAGPLAEAGVSRVITVGPLMDNLIEALPRAVSATPCADAAEAAEVVLETLSPGDVVMVKGSNAMGLSRVVEALVALGERRAARHAAG